MSYLGNTNLTAASAGLPDTGVVPGTYGSANGLSLPLITVNSKGQITTATNVTTAIANTTIVAGFIDQIPVGALGNVLTSDGTTWVTGLPPAGGGGGGSGLFNTSISEVVGYPVTTSLSNAYVAPATSGERYIIHSIHVTNINTAPANITGQFSGTTYSDITFGNTVPVPVGTSVEMLKKPKILQPNDVIQLQTEANTSLHAAITLEQVTSTAHFGSGIDITSAATYSNLHIATANSVIESILLSNDDVNSFDVKATVVFTDASDVIQGYYCFDLIVPNDATIELLEQPKFLPNGFKVRVQANQANRLEAIIAGITI
jgi:hypothetical protein